MDAGQVRQVGERLAQARAERALTLNQVGRELGMEATTLARYETGSRLPPVDTLVRLARFYHRPTAWFLGEATDAEVIAITNGVEPALLAAVRAYPPQAQRALADYLPALSSLIEKVCPTL